MIKTIAFTLLVAVILASPFDPLTTPTLNYYERRGEGLTD